MKKPVVIMGIGEIGGVFARGFLKLGYPVYPLTREQRPLELASTLPNPELLVIAVGEKDLQASIKAVPTAWHDRVVLLQNELLPRDWADSGLLTPTVISVWFEKKPGQDAKIVIPSKVYGGKSLLIHRALNAVNLPVDVLRDEQELLFELVRKNLYILTSNIAGLRTGGTVSTLWNEQREIAEPVFDDVLSLQRSLTGETMNREALLRAMLEAFNGDPEHKCMGRSAPARLQRALEIAAEQGIELPTLQAIAAENPT